MTAISHVRGCRPTSMIEFAAALRAANTSFTDRVQQMTLAVDSTMGGWKGDAATAADARKLSELLAATNVDDAAAAIADAHATHGATLNGVQASLLAIVDLEAPSAGMTVSDDGTVTAPRVIVAGMAGAFMQAQLDAQAKDLEVRIKSLLTQFGDGENQAAQAILAAQQPLTGTSDSPLGGIRVDATVRDILAGKAGLPSDPEQLEDFWKKLSPDQKNALFADDNYVGNHDGIPVVDRDHYNRIKLDDELGRAQAGDPAVAGRLEDLQQLKETVGKDPNRMLMLLDTQSGEQTHAAVAIGNPDTADHVSVTTPGLNTTVGGSMDGMVTEGSDMKNAAEAQLRMTPGRENETVSTVAWIGYDAPQLADEDLSTSEKMQGAVQVAQPWNAQAAAPHLSQFYEGVDASNERDDVHLTAVGHSYGSYTTGLALQQTPDGVVDDTVVYGSPGLGTGHDFGSGDLDKLNIEPGHAYEMTAHDDPVAHLNRFGWSPGYISEFQHLDTDATTTPDGVHRDGATGHSEYPRMGDNGELRTSGYNTSVVIAGLGDEPGKLVTGDAAVKTGAVDILQRIAGMGN